MSVGIIEIALTVFSAIVVAVVTRGQSTIWSQRKWLWGVPGVLAIAAIASPADPLSMVGFAAPTSALYCVALMRLERRLKPAG